MKAPNLWESRTGKKASSIGNVLAQLVVIESKMQVHGSEMKRSVGARTIISPVPWRLSFKFQFTAVNSL
jgi:hypothetical protein